MAVYSCGTSKVGQLGLGAFDDTFDPNVLENLKGKRITGVRAGEQHSLALTEFGDVYTWGRGREGQLGLGPGHRQNMSVPHHVKGIRHERVVSADCGSYHCIVASETGRCYSWGKLHKKDEQAGKVFGYAVQMPGMKPKSEFTEDLVGESIKAYLAGDIVDTEEEQVNFGNFFPYTQTEPLLIEPLLTKKITEVAAGYAFSLAVASDGEVFSWGFNEKGQLGHGHRFNLDKPKRIETLQDVHIKKVAAGQQHSVILSDEGHVFTCGLGVFGQLGHGDLHDQMLPKKSALMVEQGHVISEVSCGSYYTIVLTVKGELLAFGHSEYGQTGGLENYNDWAVGEMSSKTAKDKQQYHAVPRTIQGLEGKSIKQVSCGHLHTVAVTSENEVLSWGWGASGCLGHGDRRFQLFPKQIASLQGETIAQTASGWKHTLIVKSGDISTFAFDFKNLVDSKQHSDMTFNLDGKIIHAHRVVVFNRCPHMKTVLLFQQRFMYKSVPEIHVTGARYLAFMHFLRYLYTDHLKCPAHLAKEVATLAQKFKVKRLEEMCQQYKYTEKAFVIPPSSFADDMREAVNNKDYADVSFVLQGTKVSAHRAILTRRSAYMQQLLSPDSSFRERDQDTFELDDTIRVDSFISALTYLYTNDENVINPDNAIYLLQVADRFMMDDFKQVIEAFIEQSIELENACWLLEISDRYGAYRLKRACLELICESDKENWENIKNSRSLIELRQSAPHLIREIDYRASKRNWIKPGELFRMIAMSSPVPAY